MVYKFSQGQNMGAINEEYIDDREYRKVMHESKKMFEDRYLKKLMKKKKMAPRVKPKLMKIPEFKDNFVNEDLKEKLRKQMIMKKIEKAITEKLVVNDGYSYRDSMRILFEDVAVVTPFVPTEVLHSEAEEVDE